VGVSDKESLSQARGKQDKEVNFSCHQAHGGHLYITVNIYTT
jgi:hypothetical protein